MTIAYATPEYREELLAPVGDALIHLPNGAVHVVKGGFWHRSDVEPPTHNRAHSSLEFAAFVNDGRWVVQCPCGGAQLVSPDDPRFYCVDCAGERHGSKWVPVVFPREHTAISDALAARPRDKQRWSPGESLAMLRKENIEHGVG